MGQYGLAIALVLIAVIVVGAVIFMDPILRWMRKKRTDGDVTTLNLTSARPPLTADGGKMKPGSYDQLDASLAGRPGQGLSSRTERNR